MPEEVEGENGRIAALEQELARLRQREQDLTAMLENASIGLHSIGPDGTILWANQTELDMLGYTRQEYVGRLIGSFHADQTAAAEILTRLGAGETVHNYHARLTCKDGSQRTVLINSDGRWEDGRFAYARSFTRDITDRVSFEKALRESEERYRAFIHNSSEGIWRFELDHPIDISWSEDEQIDRIYEWGYLGECNDAMARMYGVDASESLTGARLVDLFVRSDPNNEAFLRAFIRAGYELREAESHERGRDGEDRYFLNALVAVIEDGFIVRAWGTQRDITHRRQMENALRASEERFARFMRHLPGAAWIKDTEGRYVYANPEAERVFRMPLEDLQGKTDHQVFPVETANQFTANDQRALQSASGIQTTETMAQEDGTHESLVSKFPILDEKGFPVSVGGIAIDITAQQQAQAALIQSQQRLDLATGAAKIGTFDWHIPTGRIVWNRQEEALFGLGAGTFEGTIGHWAMRVHPEDLPAMQAQMAEAMAQRLPELSFAFRIIHPEGCRWIEGAARFMYAPDGSPLRMVGINMDTTDRRLHELALRRLNADLEEFAFVVSHDFKEPLRMVHAYTQLLLRRYLPAETDAQEFGKYIQKGVRRMEELIDDLLAYSRTVHGEHEPGIACELQGALDRALLLLEEPIQTTGAVITHDALPTVAADLGQLTQVFQNLIGNSIKYHHPDRAPRIHIRAARADTVWRIEVIDNGIGFDPKYGERIFGLFKRLHKDKYPGTGLGLSICKRFIERYGGAITAEGRPGEGSTFAFTLPESSEARRGDA